MFCQQCGAELRDGVRFCSKCGGVITDTPEAAQLTTHPAYTAEMMSPPVKKSTRKSWSLIVLLLIVLGGGGFLGWRLISQPKIGVTRVNPIDNAVMVWVPGGTFTMGSIDAVGGKDEHPAHQVTLTGYWMYKDDVTVAQYRAFCSATGNALPHFPQPMIDNGQLSNFSWAGKSGWDDSTLQQHPIVDVSWNDAQAYASWAKVALPSEAQWEYAARGPRENNYPWGGTATAADQANGWDQMKCANGFNSRDKDISTWPVGSFAADTSWCGARDMAGNVHDWCAGWYGDYSSSPVTNPTGPATGSSRVIRGDSWDDIIESYARGADRSSYVDDPSYCDLCVGFRCASLTPVP